MYLNDFRKRLLQKIDTLESDIFVRSDLINDVSNKGQLRMNRALNAFEKEGIIIKVAHGVYSRAMQVEFENRTEIMLTRPFEEVALSVLDKLGVEWEFGDDIQRYNMGLSTQVPAELTVKLKSRYRGKISAEGKTLRYQGDRNAR